MSLCGDYGIVNDNETTLLLVCKGMLSEQTAVGVELQQLIKYLKISFKFLFQSAILPYGQSIVIRLVF